MTVDRAGTADLPARIEELQRLLAERSAQLETANKELDALFYSISHDLRAPLRHVSGFSRLLLERLGDADQTTAQYARTIANAALLRIAFGHLLSNAVKFTAKRSVAIIEIEASRKETGEVVLFVRDNGAGFDTRYVGRLFGMFQRLHREDEFKGTEAGLATVQRIIRRHGGRVWAEGEAGRGAAFYVALNGRLPD